MEKLLKRIILATPNSNECGSKGERPVSCTASRKAEIVCYLPTLVASCFQKYQGELLVLWPMLIRAKESIIGYSEVP